MFELFVVYWPSHLLRQDYQVEMINKGSNQFKRMYLYGYIAGSISPLVSFDIKLRIRRPVCQS